MQTRICVRHINPALDPDALEELFTTHGRVLRMKMYRSGPDNGYAFVDMRTPAEADSAWRALNGTEQAGRKLDLVILNSR